MADDGWQPRRFGDLATLSRNTVTPDAIDDCVYIGLEHIGEGTLSLLGTGTSSDVTSTKNRFRAGQILFGKLRPYFRKVVRPNFDGVCSTDIWVIDPTSDTDADFLFYLVASDSFVEPVVRASEGTKMPRAKWDYARDLIFDVPRHDEQRAIGAVLRAIDDKIELNRRMAQTLEEIARALFKSWFVDFDPVRAKAEGRDPNLPKHLADLFPDRLIDSELGEIPEGWSVSTVGEEFRITMGQSPPGDTYNEVGDGLPFYQGRVDFGSRFPRRRVYCSAPTRFAERDDTLVSVRAPVGDVNMASERCAIGRGVAAVRHSTGARSYTFQAMKEAGHLFAKFNAEGTVFGAINKKDFHGLMCLCPPADIVAEFERQAQGIDDRIEVCAQSVETSSALRDSLLPLLVSGEVRLPDPEGLLARLEAVA